MKSKFHSQESPVVEEASDGDGVAWFRGRLLGKGAFASVYLGLSKNPNSFIPDLMAIKSAQISASSSPKVNFFMMRNTNGAEAQITIKFQDGGPTAKPTPM
ncbi:hypothetical protein M5689_021275 [Euphorbia peplus]|nr:hypothetical protein M5689_021275 [Euphorbia peplus]